MTAMLYSQEKNAYVDVSEVPCIQGLSHHEEYKAW